MQRMRRKRADPVLMGEPSPGLSKISKMNMVQLTERIKVLEAERAHLAEKAKNLSNQTPPDESRIAALVAQQERLGALVQAAQQRLSGKEERSQRYNAGPRR